VLVKTIKKIFKSKRGVAMESALVFMIMMFSFCALITMLSAIGHNQLNIENILLARDVEVDQIGEYFLSGTLDGKLSADGMYTATQGEKQNKYHCDIDGNVLKVYNESKTNFMLYVEKNVEGKVVHWCYTDLTE
jgi:hypothetical protein